MKNEEADDRMQKMHEEEGQRIIQNLKSKISTTNNNIKISKEIIEQTPSDKEREKLIKRNTNRQHAVGSLKKEIRDIEQEMEERSREVSS